MNPVRATMFYYTYVLWSKKDKHFYTDFTVDLRKRFLKRFLALTG